LKALEEWKEGAKLFVRGEAIEYLRRLGVEPESFAGKIFLNNWAWLNRVGPESKTSGAAAKPGAFVVLCLIAFVLDTILANRGDVHIGPVSGPRSSSVSPSRAAPARSAGPPAALDALLAAIAAIEPEDQADSTTRTLFPVGLGQWGPLLLKPLDDVKAMAAKCGFAKKAAVPTADQNEARAVFQESITAAAELHPMLVETIGLAVAGRLTVGGSSVATPALLMSETRIKASVVTGENAMVPLLMLAHRFVRELKTMTTAHLTEEVWAYVKEHAFTVFAFVCNPARDDTADDGTRMGLNLPRPYVPKYAVYRPPSVSKRHQRLPNGLPLCGSHERARFVGLHDA
jgi:hypothetical protein